MHRTLIVCGGNTCRSPTLELLLRLRACRLGIQHEFTFESAGCTNGAAKGRPIPVPGQRALPSTFKWVDSQLGVNIQPADDKEISNLLREASERQSRRLDNETIRGPFDELIVLPTNYIGKWSGLLQELVPGVQPREVEVSDDGWKRWNKGWRQYLRNPRVYPHPDCDPKVLDAYQAQADTLAREMLNLYRTSDLWTG